MADTWFRHVFRLARRSTVESIASRKASLFFILASGKRGARLSADVQSLNKSASPMSRSKANLDVFGGVLVCSTTQDSPTEFEDLRKLRLTVGERVYRECDQ